MWGNHDWSALFGPEYGRPFSIGLIFGRYFEEIFKFFFLQGHLLPVATNLMSFIFFSFSAVLLCYYWRLPKSCFLYSLVGLLLVIQPYIIEWLYYSICSPINLYFFVTTGFICGDHAYTQNCWLRRTVLFICSIILFWFCIGSYPVTISTIAIVLLGRVLIDFIFSDKNKVGIKDILYSHILSISAVVSACLIHCRVCLYLKKIGILVTTYMTELLKFSDIPHRVLAILKCIPTYLLNYPVSFFTNSFTYLFTILLFMALAATIIQCFEDSVSLKHKIVNSSFVIVMFLVKESNLLKILLLLFVFCLYTYLQCKIFMRKKYGNLDLMLKRCNGQRIISRIETMPGYNDTKKYRVLILEVTKGCSNCFCSDTRGGRLF
jgi:hypothetical protein